jgi:hypothetical protein
MPMSPDDVRNAIAEAISPANFFIGPATRLEWEHVDAEDVSWEVFRGRLLDPAHTRQRRTFENWNIYLLEEAGRSAEPLLSVKWDAAAREVHVVRAILSYAHEAYDAGGNVILTREVRKWVRELVGTVTLADWEDAPGLRYDLSCRLFQAVVGTSRLPLTSVEAPLPAFTFGELAYFDIASGWFIRTPGTAGPMRSYRDLLEWRPPLRAGRGDTLDGKPFEAVLRAVPADELTTMTDLYARQFSRLAPANEIPRTAFRALRSLFNGVSLSPWTDLPEKALAFAGLVAARFGRPTHLANFLGHLLRQLGRHLTAYDLIVFHHAGANYPDALLLDLVLRSYLDLIESTPALFLDGAGDRESVPKAKRSHRRGLRQAWLIRERYRGLLVPDEPTSPGESTRVLPAPHERVPEEQILNLHRRNKLLFGDEAPGRPLGDNARAVLRQSILDLRHPDELGELGTALYLDRPLGAFKAPGEPDQTPLLSYVAFSRSIALQRLSLLGKDQSLLPENELATLRQILQALPVVGMPLAEVGSVPRPGVVSLADAAKAAEDFILLRTTSSSAIDFFFLLDMAPLISRFGLPIDMDVDWLIVGQPHHGSGEIVLTVYEANTLRKRLELSANSRDGYVVRAGVEYPRNGLRVRRVWEEIGGQLREHDLGGEELWVRPV